MTEPMTAAEYRNTHREALTVWPDGFQGRVLAALEEREALLGERAEWGKLSGQTIADAAVGALVRRIYNHPACKQRDWAFAHLRWANPVNPDSLRDAIAYLDSLLPKEPEVVVGPSGRAYGVRADGLWIRHTGAHSTDTKATTIPVEDAPVVAALLARQEGKDE